MVPGPLGSLSNGSVSSHSLKRVRECKRGSKRERECVCVRRTGVYGICAVLHYGSGFRQR